MDKRVAARLQRVIPEHELNSWEREQLLEQLSAYDPQRQEAVLVQVGILWPVSHSLCFAFLEQLEAGLACLDAQQLPEWVKGILAAYEADGLRAARLYMADVENNFLCRLRGENGLTFAEAQGRLLPYLRGLAGRNLQLATGEEAATDTETIFLPREVTFFQNRDDNFRIFKLLASFQWAFIHQDLYCHRHDTANALAAGFAAGDAPLEQADVLELFLKQFPHRQLAGDIYHLLQSVRASFFLQSHLPGLMRDARPFFALQLEDLSRLPLPEGAAASLHAVRLWLLARLAGGQCLRRSAAAARLIARLPDGMTSMAEVFSLTAEFYELLRPAAKDYDPLPPLVFQGTLQTQAAHRARLARREARKQKFIEGLAAILPPESGKKKQTTEDQPEMQTRHRFVKRQRDGDEIDVDALIEAHADVKAGHVPSERLFVRLLRDERDIAALFLVDMSSSTEGWVGTALKESLVLLSEALESLGDRYAIHGFSGMRRTRSEVYHVKGFDEPYSDEIKGRIAAIAPIDYTRMGPPIRHFTAELAEVDAKVRLLILLTDGKPEDYDDYKGEYAIEDTRHALLEAKAAGTHPFCITIDREAQDYMAHMFGKINYTFIDDVRKLPLRVPEIYRAITS